MFEDVARLAVKFDGVVACNDVGAEWSGALDGWVTLHPKKFREWSAARERNGFARAGRMVGHRPEVGLPDREIEVSEYKFPGQQTSGSSGLFAAKFALVDLGFDRAILCGIPMSNRPHFFDDKNWMGHAGFREAWFGVPEVYRLRMRSMSGWTMALLGSPRDWEDN